LEGEEQRILYVALTRSERELIIADCPFVKVDWPEVEKLIRGEDPSPTARAPIVSAATLPREMFDLLHPQAPPAPSHP
jgi:ATP-dependent exoDNAse (exonuclease V) beta subunit